ncbi:hypothetical protein J15TS10_40320 [Paenibacillus woosongensis]|uniref:Uncharacterized protein n=1 Tax=Paenibacillus woosongensis TaxID=307580 RepID=A0ABQ4MWB0_9BACL|nr:hypothetical protein J15TS10_40320 [Paenibacillus woosongensis]
MHELSFLIHDLINGLQALKQMNYVQNSEVITKYTNQLIEIMGNFLSTNENFTVVNDSFYQWRMYLLFDLGEESFRKGDHAVASKCYNSLVSVNNIDYQSIAYYRLAQVNSSSDPLYAFNMYKISFKTNNSINKLSFT